MNATRKKKRKMDRRGTFRGAVLRGLGVVLPPLLTILFFLWIWNSVAAHVLAPVESGARWLLVRSHSEEIYKSPPADVAVLNQDGQTYFEQDGTRYVRLSSGEWIPDEVRDAVARNPGDKVPTTATDYYRRYVDTHYLKPQYVVPLFVVVFVAFLYLVGRFIAARMGSIVWQALERLIQQLPIVRTVYGSVKQMTDFVFSEPEFEYTRVVAIEYPRKGIWSVGFVTSESMLDICLAAGEPIVSVLIPNSPMPATGYTITCRKSETIDLDMSIDQAVQFIVSCGVVVPDIQKHLNGQPMFPMARAALHDDSADPADGMPTLAGDR